VGHVQVCKHQDSHFHPHFLTYSMVFGQTPYFLASSAWRP